METLTVKVYVHYPAEKAFETLVNFEHFTDYKWIAEAKLLRPGEEERYGVGSLNMIRFIGVTFITEVTAFKPPWRVEYLIKKCTFPMRQELGRIDLIPRGDGTEIHWITRFEIPTPIIGPLLGKLARFIFQYFFYESLMEAKANIEEGGGPS